MTCGTVLKFFYGMLFIIIPAFIFCLKAGAEDRQSLPFPAFPKKTMVVDAGHGGKDLGVKGVGTGFEKNVTLGLATIIEKKAAQRIRIVMTRQGDYEVGLQDRLAAANGEKADLFISIHVGGSYASSASGGAIWFWTGGGGGAKKRPEWDMMQTSHVKGSRRLALILQDELKKSGAAGVTVKGAPLTILAGANMPAVMIEPGMLTNPGDAVKLGDKEYLERYADAILSGVEIFMKSQ